MRACLQRVSRAQVTVENSIVGKIEHGFVVLLGIAADDTPADARYLVEKIAGLRVFGDDQGKMNLPITETGGGVLVISQFTLYGDCRHGRRPSFVAAAPPELAQPLYEYFVQELRGLIERVETGEFRAQMTVALVNDGPVTLLLDSRKLF